LYIRLTSPSKAAEKIRLAEVYPDGRWIGRTHKRYVWNVPDWNMPEGWRCYILL
jgi:hypothetical protein